jgi:hypothetical protein
MHVFGVGCGLELEQRLVLREAVERVGREFRLDPDTSWALESGPLLAAGVHHAPAAAGARQYLSASGRVAFLFDGLPAGGYDAAELGRRWSSLAAELEGQFCVVRLDLDAGELELLTDPLGIVPVFHGARGAAHVISNHASVVAAALRLTAPDPLALASFVALGWAVERRTFIDGVRALAGGSVHRIGAHGLRSSTHFGPATVARNRRRVEIGAVAGELIGLAQGAASAGGPVRCALTAGHDTRVMAALLRAAEIPATYYTAGEASSMDIELAVELAARFGLAHELQHTDGVQRDWTAAAGRFVTQNDGLVSLIQLGDYVPLDHPVAALQTTFWGVGGEIGRAGTGPLSNVSPNLPVVSRIPQAQRRLLARKIDDGGLLSSAGRALVADYLDALIDARLAEGWPARELSEAFYTFERVASWGSTGPRRAAGVSDLFSPFCTRPFVEYCFSLRPAERYLELPHQRLIAALDAELLAHRFQVPFPRGRPGLVGLRATRRLLDALRGARHGGESGRGYLDGWLDDHRALLGELARAAPVIGELVDLSRIDSAPRDALLRLASPLWLLAGPDAAAGPYAANSSASPAQNRS